MNSLADQDEAVARWFLHQRAKYAVIGSPILMEQAQKIAIMMGVEFMPNNGWLSRFKAQQNIHFRRICGEKAAADC